MDHYLKNAPLLEILKELAMDLHWTWNHSTDKIWKQLDPVLWEATHNPLVVLQTVSSRRIESVLNDPIVAEIVKELGEAKGQRLLSPAWFQHAHPNPPLEAVAYFSMEFMLSEALPIYSGGLGNVSGDLLKTASDLGVPLIGIGLLYQQGYRRQVLYPDGSQQYITPFNDPGQLPLKPLRNADGEWLRVEIQLPGYSLWLRTWAVQVGRTRLLLLDSNDTANFPTHRGITGELYTEDPELRLLQQIVLGVGGWRLLKAMTIEAEVCHLNEGHTAFVILERICQFMEENDVSFEVALRVVRSGTVFTTHTAIGGDFDQFTPQLIQKYLGAYITDKLKISFHDFLALGRKDASDKTEPFNTGFFASRGCGSINAVSKLHQRVSQQLFAPLFPRWPLQELPISSVTNGVHMPTWDSPEADRLWTESCGKERWLGQWEDLEKNMQNVSDERLWNLRTHRSIELVYNIRRRYLRQLEMMGASFADTEAVKNILDPSILTLGFARRFVNYKRPNLLLAKPERLKQLLTNPEKPVQLILAGKAHRNDIGCQNMIREWVQFIIQYNLKDRVVFLGDYDMLLTSQLVQGVDLWLNTPRRPWEACGTSGMKVLVNGGLNLSELDGWWDEAYSPEVGWTFGDRMEMDDDRLHDEQDAERLYNVLEGEIIPAFYERNSDNIPCKWVNRMHQSMASLTSFYSSSRSLREYTEQYYIPAAIAYRQRARNHAADILGNYDRENSFKEMWEGVHFGEQEVRKTEMSYHFKIAVDLNGIDPSEITVELYSNALNKQPCLKQELIPLHDNVENQTWIYFGGEVPADRPIQYYTPRIIGKHPNLSIPLEWNFILWHH